MKLVGFFLTSVVAFFCSNVLKNQQFAMINSHFAPPLVYLQAKGHFPVSCFILFVGFLLFRVVKGKYL